VLRPRPPRHSDRLWGIAAGKGWYEPDPVTYVRNLRDEFGARIRDREALVSPQPSHSTRGDPLPSATTDCGAG
jgi:hypothetical protein